MTNRVSVGLDQAQVAAIADDLQRDLASVQAAAAGAALATADFLRRKIGEELQAETGLTDTFFARRLKRYLRTGTDARGRVWLGLFRPRASSTNLGALSQEEGGARGGRYFFPGAFIATMPNGFTGIFRRTGAFGRRGKGYLERIDTHFIDLPDAPTLAARYELSAEVFFRKAFEKRLAA